MTLAGLVRNRDRLMGIGQAITMPLFFASNALYPVDVMPQWLRWLSAVNPLSYEVNALRGAADRHAGQHLLDVAVLVVAAVAGVATRRRCCAGWCGSCERYFGADRSYTVASPTVDEWKVAATHFAMSAWPRFAPARAVARGCSRRRSTRPGAGRRRPGTAAASASGRCPRSRRSPSPLCRWTIRGPRRSTTGRWRPTTGVRVASAARRAAGCPRSGRTAEVACPARRRARPTDRRPDAAAPTVATAYAAGPASAPTSPTPSSAERDRCAASPSPTARAAPTAASDRQHQDRPPQSRAASRRCGRGATNSTRPCRQQHGHETAPVPTTFRGAPTVWCTPIANIAATGGAMDRL